MNSNYSSSGSIQMINLEEENEILNNEKILQIGCGIVGEANIKSYKHYGYDVCGLDIVPDIIKKMNDDGIDTRHPNDDLSDWNDISIILISVPTLLNKNTNKLSMNHIWTTVPTVVKLINQSTKNIIIVMRCTVPVGLTCKYERYIEYKINNLKNKKFYVAYQPEFLRERTRMDDAINPWRALFGYHPRNKIVFKRMKNILLKFVNQDENRLDICSIEEAELQKYINNTFNGLKISFSNAIYGLVRAINDEEKINIDAQKIMNMVSKTSEGMLNNKYGTSVGKHYGLSCLPKDIPSLITMSEEYKTDNRISEFLKGIENVNEWIKNTPEIQIEMEVSPNIMTYDKMI